MYTIAMAFGKSMKNVLDRGESSLFRKLNSPVKVQDFLDTLPINYEVRGETYMSPRRVIRAKTAHCFEGALFAAAALAFHGHKPMLMDLRTTNDDEDHVVALFQIDGFWGAISKTNHHILRYRDPIYASVRELALSYFNEYFLENGKKTLRAYSRPFDLSKFKPEEWLTAEEDLIDLVNALDDSPHVDVMPKKIEKKLRKADRFERKSLGSKEWTRRGKRS